MRIARSVRSEPESPGKWRLPALLAMAGAVLGGSWLSQKVLFRQQSNPTGRGYKMIGEPDPASESFLFAVEAITGAPITRGNRVEVLINGDQIFPSMLAAIRSARETVNLLTFIYWKGPIAPEVAEAICERASQGVKCNVLLDAIGAAPIDRSLVDKMRECGANVAWFRPPSVFSLHKLDNRTHRKVLVVDGKVGFTGGVGIAEEWMGNAHDPLHWRDTHVRVEGPAVRGLQGAFCENWLEATGEVLAGPEYLPELPPLEDGVKAQVTRSSAGKGDTDAATLFFLALAAARQRVWLTTAYFVPTPTFVDALVDTVRRGVDVRVLVPGSYIDKKLVRKAGQASYSELMRAGIKIFEYQPTMLHAKTIVVDGMWATVGSTNFDNRSFSLNDEVNISFHDAQISKILEQQFEIDLAVSKQFTRRRWSRRDAWQRVQEKLGSLVSREL